MRSVRQYSRRTYLKSIGAGIGLSMTGANVSAAPNDSVELVTAKSGDKAVETTEVPQEWYEYEQRVDKQRKDLVQSYQSNSGIVSVEFTPSEEQVDGLSKSKILVFTNRNTTSKSLNVPSVSEGIPVEAQTAPDYRLPTQVGQESNGEVGTESHGGCHNDRNYNNIYGGVEMGPPGGGYGTCATVIKKPSGKQFMLHADHVWSSCGYDTGEAVSQNTQRVGRVWGQSSTYDYILVERTNGPPYFYPGIRFSSDGNRHRMAGRKTENGLRVAMSNGNYVYKQGVTSGFNRGKIRGLGAGTNVECISYNNNGVRCELRSTHGDSGGPIFMNGPGSDVYLAGHVSVIYNRTSQEAGCNGYNLWNYTIGSPFYMIHRRGDFTVVH